ncbi:MAG: HAD family hydrolase [Deltaproteobacteria bacterium]|nr:HAD family hydrolase [Deltaproteobacteria bacterium]
MFELNVPSRGELRLQYLVLDLNGTIALDGKLLPGVSERVHKLRAFLEPWLVSADTQGTLADLAASLGVKAKRLNPGDEAAQKSALVEELDPARVVAIGNGSNDAAMLRRAALGIAVLGDEGLAKECLAAADLIIPHIRPALDLLLFPRRLLATLRR